MAQLQQLLQQAQHFQARGDLKAAEQAYLQARKIDPEDPAIHYELANMYLAHGQTTNAIAGFQAALKLAPEHPQILLQLGNCYSANHALLEAINYFKRSADAEPSDAAYYNLGNVQRELGLTEQAIQSYQRAIQLNPQDADTYNNLGNALREVGELEQSVLAYQKALDINPMLYHAKVHLVHQKQHMCDWQNLSQEIAEIKTWVTQSPKAQISPFAFLAMPSTDASMQLKCACNWLNNKYNQLKKLEKIKSKNKKIKIAYLSSDFRLHPLAYLITEVIERHDRNRFEVYAYAYSRADKSDERVRLENAFDHFYDTNAWSLEATAQHIAENNIDILIDLTGYTQTSRSGIAAMRPAQVQVNWLGFPGSMGYLQSTNGVTPLFDYLIGDDIVTPHGIEHAYAEKIIRLPCYQPNNSYRPVGASPARAALGLPENGFVFCCFNQTFKITPDVFSAWMRILKAVPNSVLWLLACNPWAQKNLIEQAQAHGIDAGRLVFATRVSIADHLARHVHADLFLDTLPYNAHTTCSDALWMSLPVLTCMGDTFASRVAASLLHNCGLDSLITRDLVSYEARAIQLAQSTEEYQQVKKMMANPAQLPIFDTSRFVQKLEQAYLDMLE